MVIILAGIFGEMENYHFLKEIKLFSKIEDGKEVGLEKLVFEDDFS
jgi:hypothetical protein